MTASIQDGVELAVGNRIEIKPPAYLERRLRYPGGRKYRSALRRLGGLPCGSYVVTRISSAGTPLVLERHLP